MRKILTVVSVCAIVCTAVMLCLLPVTDADDGDTATIEGYIMINGTYSKNSDIVISFYSSEINFVRTVGIDEDGFFSIEVPGGLKSSECQISFMLKGYGVSSLPSSITEVSEKSGDEIRYYLSDSFAGGTITAGNKYSLCGKDLHSISMTSTYGSIHGTVFTNFEKPIGVNDVKVTLKDGDTVKMVVTTSRGGKFSIDQCPTGTYTLEFSASGYKSTSETVTVENGDTKNVNVTIEKNTVANGLTAVQITMIVCGAIASALIAVAIIGFILNRVSGKHFILNKKN